jgi:hypothetical protein
MKRMTQRGGVITSTEGEAALGKEKRGDNMSWADVNLTWLKNEKNHAIDLTAIN